MNVSGNAGISIVRIKNIPGIHHSGGIEMTFEIIIDGKIKYVVAKNEKELKEKYIGKKIKITGAML